MTNSFTKHWLRTAVLASCAMVAALSANAQQSLDQLVKKGIVLPPKDPAPQQTPAQPVQSAPRPNGVRPASAPVPPPTGSNQGFRMSLPTGWRAGLAENGAVFARSADGESSVMIAPLAGSGNVTAIDWLRRGANAALGGYLKGANVTAVIQSHVGREAALASVQYTSASGPGIANVLCLMTGKVGTLYVIAAPQRVFAQERAVMVQALQSFSFTGEKQAGPANGERAAALNVNFTKFTDRHEGAFSVDYPAGWKVEGGMVRKSTVDVRPYVYATSPDGSVTIRFGDPELPAFTVPTQVLMMGGLREGSRYSPGYGNMLIVRRYTPGPAFAQEYAMRLVQSVGAAGVQFKSVEPKPQYNSTTNIGPAVQRTTAGEANFICNRNGQEYAGTVFAQTTGTSMPGTLGELWYVSTLADFIAPAARVTEADQIARHMAGTFQVNPNWMAQQQRTTMATSQIVTDTNEHVSKIINDTYWSRQRVLDRTNRNFDDYIRGVVRLRDPNTGEELEGRAGKNYYYRVPNTDNKTVGSDVTIHDPDFTELEQVH